MLMYQLNTLSWIDYRCFKGLDSFFLGIIIIEPYRLILNIRYNKINSNGDLLAQELILTADFYILAEYISLCPFLFIYFVTDRVSFQRMKAGDIEQMTTIYFDICGGENSIATELAAP